MNFLDGKKTKISAIGLIVIYALKMINGYIMPLPETLMALMTQTELLFTGTGILGLGHKAEKLMKK